MYVALCIRSKVLCNIDTRDLLLFNKGNNRYSYILVPVLLGQRYVSCGSVVIISNFYIQLSYVVVVTCARII